MTSSAFYYPKYTGLIIGIRLANIVGGETERGNILISEGGVIARIEI